MTIYIVNKCISSLHNKIPDEAFFNKKIDSNELKIFGTDVMVHMHIPKEKKKKWDKKSIKLTFVGYDDNTKWL